MSLPDLLFQPEKQVSRGWGNGDALAYSVCIDDEAGGNPVCRAHVIILLQHKAGGRISPRDDDAVTGVRDGQQWRSRRLHRANETPETARDRVTITNHRRTGIVLADGAADEKHTTRARATTTRSFKPVNRVLLRKSK